MAINIRDFVDVTITKKDTPRKFVYDTVIYNPTVDFENAGVNDDAYYANVSSDKSGDGKTKETAISYLTVSNTTQFYKWADLYFRNGGKYIHTQSSLSLDNGVWRNASADADIPLNEIIVYNPDADFTGSCGDGIYQKIFLLGTTSKPREGVVQFTESDNMPNANIVSATVAAYYTSIALDSTDSVKDCMFTKIKCTDSEFNTYVSETIGLNTNDHIIGDYLAGAYRLLGGNDSLGNELTNVWAKIVLTQALTNDLLVLLTSKIRLDSNGIASVKAACSRVLNRFVTNGYINTEKAWTEPDLYIDGELIAAENTPLIDGYKIHVGPITQDNIEKHQIPPVYILYGDQVGVRKIVVTGEVF